MGPLIPFPLPDPLLTLHSVDESEEKITLVVEPSTQSSICPACQTSTTRRHSRYSRAIQDLPMNNKQVELLLLARKWFCDSPSCSTEVFTERYEWILPKKRRTLRAEELLRKLAFSTSCLNAEKLSRHLHLPVSHDTLLTLIRHTPDSHEVSPFHGILKRELVYQTKYKTREVAKKSLFEYIGFFYNSKRIHSTLGYNTPNEFERMYGNSAA